MLLVITIAVLLVVTLEIVEFELIHALKFKMKRGLIKFILTANIYLTLKILIFISFII